MTERETETTFVRFHSLLHQETLLSKRFRMNHIINTVIQIAECIRARAFNHHEF